MRAYTDGSISHFAIKKIPQPGTSFVRFLVILISIQIATDAYVEIILLIYYN